MITKRLSIDSFKNEGGTEEHWHSTEKAQALVAREKLYQIETNSCNRQAERLDSTNNLEQSQRNAFISLWTTSSRGLAVSNTGEGDRDTRIQSPFRQELIKIYDVEGDNDFLWCPVLCEYVDQGFVTASHIFPYRSGQDLMNTIFGEIAVEEMFSWRNGMILSNAVEELLETGFFAIVPDVASDASARDIEEWEK